jgi:hypothetical protein
MQRQTNKILGLLGSKKRVGALEFKTIEERLAMKQDLRDLYAADLAAGKKTMSDIEDMYLEQLLDDAIERFAGGPFSRRILSPEEIQDIKALARVNPHAIEDISASKLKEVLIGKGSVVKTEPSMVDVSTLSKAMKDEGYEALGNFVVTAGKALDSNQLALAQYRNFYLGFATRPFKFTNGSFANPATIFIRRNGLATAADMEKATEDMMLAIGFIRDKGRYIAGDQNKINEFLNQSRHTLRDADAEQSAIALDYIESMFADLTFRFHGSYDQINHKLLNFLSLKQTKQETHCLLLKLFKI